MKLSLFLQVLIGTILIFVVGMLFYQHSGYFQFEHNPMQYMPNMHHGKSLKPQRGYDFYQDGLGARTPPAGVLARTQVPYPYASTVGAADVAKFKNPLPATRETLARGQHLYMSYCVVCHGPEADGKGYIVPPFPMPPSLHTDKIKGYADSQIFHVITNGQNTMGSYAPQIRELDRWAVIHYVRALQKAQAPSQADLDALEKSGDK